MSSASRGSGTRRRMKLRSRDCSRSTTSEIRWSCSNAIRSGLAASVIHGCRRMRGENIVGSGGVVKNRIFQGLQRSREEMVGRLDPFQPLWPGDPLVHRLEFLPRRELVVGALQEDLGDGAG